MEIKNVELMVFINNFSTKQRVQMKLPAVLNWALIRNVEEATRALKAYYVQKKELLMQFAEKEDGKPAVDENDHFIIADEEGWNTAIRELLEKEVEICITQVSVAELAKCDEPEFDSLNDEQIRALIFMIKQ